jgi:hypothetical protein
MATNYLCKNCEKTCDPSFTYCPSCGQETANKLTVGVLFSNTISNYFSIDGRFFKSFIPLMIKPGALAKRFVDGKRRLYLHPAQFYLFISILFFFLFSFSVRKADDQISRTLKNVFSQEVSIDSLAINREEIDQAIDSLVTAKQKLLEIASAFRKKSSIRSLLMELQKQKNSRPWGKRRGEWPKCFSFCPRSTRRVQTQSRLWLFEYQLFIAS